MLKALGKEKLPCVEGETPACPKFSVYNYITLAAFDYCVSSRSTWLIPTVEALGAGVPASRSRLLLSTALLTGKFLFPQPASAACHLWLESTGAGSLRGGGVGERVFPQMGGQDC